MTDEKIKLEELLYRYVHASCVDLAKQIKEDSGGKLRLSVHPELTFDFESDLFEITPEVEQVMVDTFVSPKIEERIADFGIEKRKVFREIRQKMTEVIESLGYHISQRGGFSEGFSAGLRQNLRANVSMRYEDIQRERKTISREYLNDKQAAWESEVRCAVFDSMNYLGRWMGYASLQVDKDGYWVQTAKREELVDEESIAKNREGTCVSDDRNWRVCEPAEIDRETKE